MSTVILAAVNFALGCFDVYVTRRHIVRYGTQVETNELIVLLATRLGPELAALIGVILPTALWTLLLSGLGYNIPLAILVGYNLRRFVLRLSTLKFEYDLLKIKKHIDSGSTSATLPEGESTPQVDPSSSSKEDPFKYS